MPLGGVPAHDRTPGVKEGNEGASATQSVVPTLKSEIRLSLRGLDQKLPRSTFTATLGEVNHNYKVP